MCNGPNPQTWLQNPLVRYLQSIVLFLVMVGLGGCHCNFNYRSTGEVEFSKQTSDLYNYYLDGNKTKLQHFLDADIWLMEQHRGCDILTSSEEEDLKKRIDLICSMLSRIR